MTDAIKCESCDALKKEIEELKILLQQMSEGL